MDFDGRTRKASQLIQRVSVWLETAKIPYAYSGAELLRQTDGFHESLMALDDATSQRIRYFPDVVLSNKVSWLLEIKNSKAIERAAFEVYQDLATIGYNVGLCMPHPAQQRKITFIDVTNIYWQDPRNRPDSQHHSKCQHADIPVFDEKWITPRELDEANYTLWKEEHSGGSGTAHGYPDFNTTPYNVLFEK